MSDHVDINKLPFADYARLMAERGAKTFGNADTPKLTFDEIVASPMTFAEIEAEYGEETAINAGIARDPDDFELDDEWFARARPASEAVPHIVERWRRTRGKQKMPTKQIVSILLDADLVSHFRESGPGWQTRLNETLRRAVFNEA
jgi:uncharacterized protein (DUF4415 family)